MKIVNDTPAGLMISFRHGGGKNGCGFIPPNGPPLEYKTTDTIEVGASFHNPSLTFYEVTDATTITVTATKK